MSKKNEPTAPETTGIPGETGREADVPPQTEENAVARTDDAKPGESEIIPTEPEAGPPVSELPQSGNAGNENGPKGGTEKPVERKTGTAPPRAQVRGHRVRIQRADGSRIWHFEGTTDAETAMALARSRGLGIIVSDEAEPTDKDGLPIKRDSKS